MSRLYERIEEDLRTSMKGKDAAKTSCLRMLKAALQLMEAEKGRTHPLSDEEVLSAVERLIKQRREAAELYQKAGAQERAEEELEDISILQTYLPPQLSDEEITSMIEQLVREAPEGAKVNLGWLMKELMPRVKGRAEGGRVRELATSFLSNETTERTKKKRIV